MAMGWGGCRLTCSRDRDVPDVFGGHVPEREGPVADPARPAVLPGRPPGRRACERTRVGARGKRGKRTGISALARRADRPSSAGRADSRPVMRRWSGTTGSSPGADVLFGCT